MRVDKNIKLEKELYFWVKKIIRKNGSISNTQIKNIAISIALKFGIEDFTANNGWIYRFKKRYSVSRLKQQRFCILF